MLDTLGAFVALESVSCDPSLSMPTITEHSAL